MIKTIARACLYLVCAVAAVVTFGALAAAVDPPGSTIPAGAPLYVPVHAPEPGAGRYFTPDATGRGRDMAPTQ